jgi:hypothetical protein
MSQLRAFGSAVSLDNAPRKRWRRLVGVANGILDRTLRTCRIARAAMLSVTMRDAGRG